ncbi:hypothetical protein [Proteus phage PM2]|uniref:LysM domain-containing protein n=1 Tax=Proteus phage PM2 TaxID=2025809 RepID=A0A249XWK6_9CAUD|nr:hypothetical protein KNT71_gp087 [Proteus phage PM2]ASZ76373.1 hypothetical protein [Proteus phage PM2]
MKIILTSLENQSRFMVDTRNIIGAIETEFGSEVSIVKRGIGYNEGNDEVISLKVFNSIDFLTASINRDSNLMTYEVRYKDTLGDISLNLGVSIEYLKILNNIVDENKIFVGQTLYY